MGGVKLQGNDFLDGDSLVCGAWELRVTARCLREDLGLDPDKVSFEDVLRLPIGKGFYRERRVKSIGAKRVAPMKGGHEVWRFAQGEDLRGGTFFDRRHKVVWLVGCAGHRSGATDDFFPWLKSLEPEEYLPAEEDFRRLGENRARRLTSQIVVEAPILLKQARESEGEVTQKLGGVFGVMVSVEIADDVNEVFASAIVEKPDDIAYLELAVAAMAPDAPWEAAYSLPHRQLRQFEYVLTAMWEHDDTP